MEATFELLLWQAWELWKEGRAAELIDPSLSESSPVEQVLRCIHVGMLCMQEMAMDRPNMQTVVQMLESESIEMGKPKVPSFIPMGYKEGMDTWNGNQIPASLDDVLDDAAVPGS